MDVDRTSSEGSILFRFANAVGVVIRHRRNSSGRLDEDQSAALRMVEDVLSPGACPLETVAAGR